MGTAGARRSPEGNGSVSGSEYCNICENFPCLGNHPEDIHAEARGRYERAAACIRQGWVTWPGPAPTYFSPFRNSLVIREALEMERRAALERDRHEWLEGIRRRLGLVAEVHRCQVHKGNPEWIWSCLRHGCNAAGYFCPSQADAFGKALAHAGRFIPKPPEEDPVTELDALAFEAAWDAMQERQARFAAALPARISAVTEQVNDTFAGLLPPGMRFEWSAGGE